MGIQSHSVERFRDTTLSALPRSMDQRATIRQIIALAQEGCLIG
jgi:hypothetical protein